METNANNTLLKEMLVSLLRKALFTAGSFLVAKGWLSQDLANHLVGDSFIWYIAGFIVMAGSIIWQYAKIKFNKVAIKEGIKADPGTPIEVVKTDALAKASFVTSL